MVNGFLLGGLSPVAFPSCHWGSLLILVNKGPICQADGSSLPLRPCLARCQVLSKHLWNEQLNKQKGVALNLSPVERMIKINPQGFLENEGRGRQLVDFISGCILEHCQQQESSGCVVWMAGNEAA